MTRSDWISIGSAVIGLVAVAVGALQLRSAETVASASNSYQMQKDLADATDRLILGLSQGQSDLEVDVQYVLWNQRFEIVHWAYNTGKVDSDTWRQFLSRQCLIHEPTGFGIGADGSVRQSLLKELCQESKN